MTTLIVCCTIAFCVLCLTVYNVKAVSARLYKQLCVEDNLPKSPYGVTRTKNRAGDIGYTITKDGKIMHIAGSTGSQYEVYTLLRTAISHINVLEKIEGYKKTTL